MHTLHIVTPSHGTTSATCINLMRLAVSNLGGDHQVIVIGNQEDVSDLRSMGLSVLGNVDGIVDSSKTLGSRFQDIVNRSMNTNEAYSIIAWGWHSASVTSGIEVNANVIAIVDEVDSFCSLNSNRIKIIPTSWTCTRYLQSFGIPEDVITEPLIGVNPTTLVVDQAVVRDALLIDQSKLVIGVVGSLSSWKEIIAMAVRLRATNVHAEFIILPHYTYSTQLNVAAKQHRVEDMFHHTPVTLRSIDVVKVADCIWAPSIASYDISCGVLDVVSIAWEGVPLATQASHPVVGVPTVGKYIAWASDELEISNWFFALANDSHAWEQKSVDLTTRIRTISSPSKFIEGLQLRM